VPVGRSARLCLLSIALGLAACRSSAVEETPLPVPSVSAALEAPAPRRPTLHHYLARTAERCELYSVDRDVVSPAERTPCPEDLEVGERIRVAGKSCIREGDPERVRPVVCPNALLRMNLRSRDGGV